MCDCAQLQRELNETQETLRRLLSELDKLGPRGTTSAERAEHYLILSRIMSIAAREEEANGNGND